MNKFLCIHGHFYQPPREDPWLGVVLPEGSAAPALDWNGRITRESYGPMGWARRLDGSGKIFEIVNLYEWISFNFGPTLLGWLERSAPDVYARVIEGDKRSLLRWGHGNAMAQVHHHVILPLASPLDRRLEVAWGLEDFRARYGRDPDGMWLAEAAVDTDSLEVLAEAGIRYVILAPRQAASVAPLDHRSRFEPVNEGTLDVSQAYLAELPSGRSMAVFFYNGPISQAVAFEKLLTDGENFWRRLSGSFAGPGLLPLATDGETYGHHFPFGEMALAYVLTHAAKGRDGWELTNFGAHLDRCPPAMRVQLHEPSSWSCYHGVERWRSDCGCVTGGHPGWNQQWRAPLRQALDTLKARLDAHFFAAGQPLFKDPEQALLDYGRVLARSESCDSFAARHLKPGLPRSGTAAAFKLLAMEQWGLASFASCAWFFDDLARIEPVNSLTFALRAMELAGRTGAPDMETKFLAILERAVSNQPGKGNGRDIWEREVKPRRETPDSLAAQALVSLWAVDGLPAKGDTAVARWPSVSAEVSIIEAGAEGLAGTLTLAWDLEAAPDQYLWEWNRSAVTDPLGSTFRTFEAGPAEAGTIPPDAPLYDLSRLPWNKRQALACTWVEAAAAKAAARMEVLSEQGLGLFQAYDSYQSTQTRAEDWASLWPGLVMARVRGADIERQAAVDLVRLLQELGRTHPERNAVATRIVDEILALMSRPSIPWKEVESMLARTHELDLRPDLWKLQNRIWELRPLPSEGKQTARLLWFSEGAA